MTGVGPWELGQELGRGGNGVVFRARDPRDGREAAVKLMLETLDVEARRRFEREVHILTRLDHPAIVRLLDRGVTPEGRPWLALELCPGGTLEARVEARGPLSSPEAARLGAVLADALAQAHAAGAIHRDVKPGNVLWAADGGPRLSDFGLVRALTSDATRLTETGTTMGTPAYMPPEQVRGEPVGPAADLYALGATLYFALTGAPPYAGPSPIAVLEQVLAREPRPPRAVRSGIDPRLERLVLRCMARDPALRPASARQLATELERCQRPAARRAPRLALGLLGALALALAAGVPIAAGRRGAPADPGLVASAAPVPTAAPTAEAQARALCEEAQAHPERDAQETLALLDRAVEIAPRFDLPLRMRAMLHCYVSDWAGAVADTGRALELVSGLEAADVLLLQGEAHGQMGDRSAREEDLRRAGEILDALPASRELRVLLLRAEVARQRGDVRAALELADEVLVLDPSSFEARRVRGHAYALSGQYTAAEAELTHALEISPGAAAALQLRAQVREDLHDPRGALEDWRALASRLGHNGNVWMRVAKLEIELGLFEDAERNVRQAEARGIDPHYCALLRYQIHQRRGDARAALAALEEAVARAPDDVQAVGARGKLKADLGDLQGGLADLDRYLASFPDDSDTRLTRAGVLCRLLQHRRALADVEVAEARGGPAVEVASLRGRILLDLGEVEAAARELDRAVQLGSRAPGTLLARARIRLGRRDFAGALEDAEEALRRIPNDVSALLVRARARVGTGDLDGAETDLRRAGELLGSSGQPDAKAYLDSVQGELEKARGR